MAATRRAIPQETILRVCELLGLDPSEVHRIEITPERVIASRNYAVLSEADAALNPHLPTEDPKEN